MTSHRRSVARELRFAVLEEAILHPEFYQRNVTYGIRSPWNLLFSRCQSVSRTLTTTPLRPCRPLLSAANHRNVRYKPTSCPKPTETHRKWATNRRPLPICDCLRHQGGTNPDRNQNVGGHTGARLTAHSNCNALECELDVPMHPFLVHDARWWPNESIGRPHWHRLSV